ncbi:SDR family NAD(P)-dependent oxidoreductase [Chitinimonas arctica]|uniref:SDR family NAD(P)-dependent oxidoreductase n=1 Tax=Chitinimonas arctica TaxID=2594795 RepID=A0A516SJP7_9NEIS|nr:SDR family NAD(P)-dependent oxidoreductase [Chitinimonas arctica]QDQ28370.1 SDR family NAD(P)-dependent oxidoreductase [Chitinimonas arctica]
MYSPVVLITGASTGIGLASAQAFAAAGWTVLAASRTPERLAAAAGIRAVLLDPCSASQRAEMVALLQQEYGGRLDCLVNNAGYAQSGPVELLDEQGWRAQMEVNLIAPALLTAALLPALRLARGSVINISSILGRSGYAWQGAYCASKFGLEGWSEALMLETQGQGVRVHLIEPGSTASDFDGHMQRIASLPPLYQAAGTRFASLRLRLAGRAQPAGKVAAVIVRTATRRRAPFRQQVGLDARAAGWLMACLPASWYNGLNRLLARRLFGLGGER